jgi:uncharacterized membrane protein
MARAVREAERLNIPGRRKRSTIPTIKVDRDAFGKFAEAFARFMGTARFLFGMTVVIVLWVLWNVPWGPPRPRFDEYPFIFLTLVLSLQASYAAPLILLAQNRQEARDRVALERDREQAAQSRADMDFRARLPACGCRLASWPPATTCAQSSGQSYAPSSLSSKAKRRQPDQASTEMNARRVDKPTHLRWGHARPAIQRRVHNIHR